MAAVDAHRNALKSCKSTKMPIRCINLVSEKNGRIYKLKHVEMLNSSTKKYTFAAWFPVASEVMVLDLIPMPTMKARQGRSKGEFSSTIKKA